MIIINGAKLGVARAPPLFLPRPELKYIYVLHTSAPPRTYLVRATLLLSPDWRQVGFFRERVKINYVSYKPWQYS